MLTRRAFLGGLAGAGALSMVPGPAAAASSRVLTATDVHVKDYPTVTAVRWIGEQLERETGGRLRMRQYHSGQLGREAEAIDMARHGAIDITRVFSGALNNAFPLTRALCLPYVFESVTHLRRVLDGEVGSRVLAGFASRGLVGLAIYDSGARCFYNTHRPLHRPADLRGLKVRVPASDIFIDLARVLGANPTPLSYGEVFSALETRLIDGAENNMRSFHASRQFEVARHWSRTEHSYAPDVLLMSTRSFNSLSSRDRGLLRELGRASVPVMRAAWDASESAARQAVTTAGVAFNAVDAMAFRQAARPLLDRQLQEPAVAALHRQILALA